MVSSQDIIIGGRYHKSHFCCDIKITFSKTDMTNSVTEIPEVRVQLPKWHVTLHLYVQHYEQCGGMVVHATISSNAGFKPRNTNKLQQLCLIPQRHGSCIIWQAARGNPFLKEHKVNRSRESSESTERS